MADYYSDVSVTADPSWTFNIEGITKGMYFEPIGETYDEVSGSWTVNVWFIPSIANPTFEDGERFLFGWEFGVTAQGSTDFHTQNYSGFSGLSAIANITATTEADGAPVTPYAGFTTNMAINPSGLPNFQLDTISPSDPGFAFYIYDASGAAYWQHLGLGQMKMSLEYTGDLIWDGQLFGSIDLSEGAYTDFWQNYVKTYEQAPE